MQSPKKEEMACLPFQNFESAYFSDCVDKRVVSFVEGQSPGTIDDSAVDVSSKVDLKFKIATSLNVKANS